MNITDCDYFYGNRTPYIKRIYEKTQHPYFGNEKTLFSELTQYNHSLISTSCFNANGKCSRECSRQEMIHFFIRNSESLLVPCIQDRVFSYCQHHYLFTVDLKSSRCSSFARQPCMDGLSSHIEIVTLRTELK